MSPDLAERVKQAIWGLRNGVDDDEGDPYITTTPERMEARHEAARQATGDGPDLADFDIRLNISDDCQFCTVHGFEGQAQWQAAEAIAGAGKLIHDLRDALLATEAERDALAKFKAYVHARLDGAGVPVDPPSPHRDKGCRIGGRLDWLLTNDSRLQHATNLAGERDAAKDALDRIRERVLHLTGPVEVNDVLGIIDEESP